MKIKLKINKMIPTSMIIFILFIFAYVTIYILNDAWNKIKLYTPSWGNAETIGVFVYLFLFFLSLNFVLLKSINRLEYFLFITTCVSFAFTVYSVQTVNLKEAFIIASIVLFLLLSTVILTFITKNNRDKLMVSIPIIIFVYLYFWLLETHNNYIE